MSEPFSIVGRLADRSDPDLYRVTVVDGKIATIEPADITDANDVVLPSGVSLAPGFIDLQINGYAAHDFTSAPESVGHAAALLPATGVTAFVPTVVTTSPNRYDRLAAVPIPAPGAGAAAALGWHLEGPWIAVPGAHDPAVFSTPADKLEPARVGATMVTVAPEVPGVLEAIPQLVDLGITVAIGHTAADYDLAAAAFRAGATVLTHVCNAMPVMHHRHPGPIAAAFDDDSVSVTVIADRIHITDPMLRVLWRLFGPDRLVLVTDTIATSAKTLAGVDVSVTDRRAQKSDGTLAGSVLTMNEAVANIQTAVGCALEDAIQTASTNPASVLGDPTRGRLRPGARADLIAITANGVVVESWVAGVHREHPPG